jgi:adenine-specific DNA-methyltransferase
MDRVPKNLYSEVVANQKQWDQWGQMKMLRTANQDIQKNVTPGTVAFLEANPYLMIDTSLYDLSFKGKLLGELDDVDNNIDGLLIHGDNFQALNLLNKRYSNEVQCVYIDPPYNTSENGFFYKNQYKHSSWLSMISSRVSLSVDILKDSGVLCCAIDDLELPYLEATLDEIFDFENRLGNIAVEIKPSGRTNDKY